MRQKEMLEAAALLREEGASFMSWRESLSAIPTINQLQERANEFREEELKKCTRKLSGANLNEKVLEAANINHGPITRIPFGISIPHGYYGCYTTDTEQVIGRSADEIDRRVKLMDKMESRGNRWNEVKSDFSGLGLRFDDMEEYFGDWNPFD